MRLDNVAHADLRIATGFGPDFGDAVNQIPLFVPEFEAAQRDYPILFQRGADGGLQAVAILGFEKDENLFLEGGQWLGGHVPAMVSKGPFLIGFAEGAPVIHVDLDHPRVAADGRGEDVFLPHGGHGPALERAIAALQTLHLGHDLAAEATRLFDQFDLVASVALEVQLSDSKLYRFSDYLVIQHAQIARLDGAALATLNQAGLLMPAIFAASSLANMERLAARKRARLR